MKLRNRETEKEKNGKRMNRERNRIKRRERERERERNEGRESEGGRYHIKSRLSNFCVVIIPFKVAVNHQRC